MILPSIVYYIILRGKIKLMPPKRLNVIFEITLDIIQSNLFKTEEMEAQRNKSTKMQEFYFNKSLKFWKTFKKEIFLYSDLLRELYYK